jgi:hypothetical protein
MRKNMNSKQIAGLLAAGAIVLGAAACQSSSSGSAAAPAATTPTAAAPADTTPTAAAAPADTTPAAATAASDTQVCNDVNTWESNNNGQAATAFGTDDASTAIVTEASGTSAVDSDVQNLSADTGSSAATDLSSLTTDCATTGVTLTGSDFTQAAAAPTTEPSTPAPSTPAMSVGDQQAVSSAQGYLNLGSGFSDQSLLKQLTSSYGSGFSTSDAEFAINYLKPDWDAQAVEAAQGYLKLGTGFSRSSLIQQLTSSYGDGFTEAQAEYAVSKVGL